MESIYSHGILDALELAYAAIIYLKYITKTGGTSVKFVTAKSQIVPARKKFTIPCIELLGNYILTKLMTSVREAISEEIVVSNDLCWSDSMISLSCIFHCHGSDHGRRN